jgi:hypothetical protein
MEEREKKPNCDVDVKSKEAKNRETYVVVM